MTVHATQVVEKGAKNPNNEVYRTAGIFLWTVEQYLKIIDDGILTENDKTELLAGYITTKMPSNKPNDTVIGDLQDFFIKKYFGKHTLRAERAVRLSETSMPEPDYVVAVYSEDNYRKEWPGVPEILLLVEVSDSTLFADRNFKQHLYAKAGIKEYWIVNIPNQQIEIHLRPDAETETYARIEHHKQGETFESPFVGEVSVDDILPVEKGG